MFYDPPDHMQYDGRSDESFSLYVSNLPIELDEDGIARLFETYGDVTIFSPPRATWAFVSYKTYGQAEYAIRSLNNKRPLYLKVAFRKKKEPKVGGPVPDGYVKDFRYADNGILPNGNCRNFMPGAIGSNLPRFAEYHNDIDANSVYPSDLDHNTYDPYETAGRYADTNAMWSRGCMNVDAYGRRYVSMGRGFTRFLIPEPHPNIEQRITEIHERRCAGLYEYGEDKLKSRVGKCQLCGRVAHLQCEFCAKFYCSKQCQLNDWSRHKMECRTMPSFMDMVEYM